MASITPHDDVLRHFQKQHESGQESAALECGAYCGRHGLDLPRWTQRALAERLADWRSEPLIDLNDALLGTRRRRGGRQADPRTAARVRQRQETLFAAYRAAEMAGFSVRPSADNHDALGCRYVGSDSRATVAKGLLRALREKGYKQPSKILREQWNLELHEPDRLQSPVPTLTVAGEVVPPPTGTLVTSTQNAILCSGTLHGLLTH